MGQSLNQSLGQATDDYVDQPVDRPVYRSVNQSMEECVDPSVHHSVDRSVDEHADQPEYNQAVDHSEIQSVNQSSIAIRISARHCRHGVCFDEISKQFVNSKWPFVRQHLVSVMMPSNPWTICLRWLVTVAKNLVLLINNQHKVHWTR